MGHAFSSHGEEFYGSRDLVFSTMIQLFVAVMKWLGDL
jgi:hypothetical protein